MTPDRHPSGRTCPQGTNAYEVAQVMSSNDIGDVVVISDDGGRPIGLVTDRDLVVRVLAEGLDPQDGLDR